MTNATDSRAAHYIKARARGMTAAAAWQAAARGMAHAEERRAAWEDAKAALAAAWQAGGMKEPRRYDPAGEELAALRVAERKASATYFKAWATGREAARPYAGTWQSESGHYFAQAPDSMFRDYQDAQGDCRGYYDNPHGESFRDGTGLVIPVVAQLVGRGGLARYVAGYRYGGEDDGGATFDLSRIFEEEAPEDAAREAARAADQLAEQAAEEARDHATAYEAGRQWAELKEEEDAARAAALALLAERREVNAARIPPQARPYAPAICAAIRDSVAGHWQTIQRNRAKRAELADGDAPGLIFWPGDAGLRASFEDGKASA